MLQYRYLLCFFVLCCFACSNQPAGSGSANNTGSSTDSDTDKAGSTTKSSSTTFANAVVVSSEGSEGSSLVLDSSGKTKIAFYTRNFDSKLKIATEGNDSWSIEEWGSAEVPLGLSNGAGPAMVRDSDNKLHVSYYDGSDTRYGTNETGSFSGSVIAAGANAISSIAIDSGGILYVAYSTLSDEDLIYATSINGSSWSSTTVDNGNQVGFFSSLIIDSQKKIHIAYWDRGNNAVKYATNASGAWITQTVGAGGAGISAQIDSKDKMHIVYFGGSNGLKYATNASGYWVIETAYSASGEVGQEPSLVLDSNGKSHVCHHDHPSDALRYTSNASGTWRSSIAENGSGNISSVVGRNCSIALTSSEKVVICYDDGSRLKCIKEQ